MGQVLVVGGIHLMVFRLLILATWVRLAFTGILFKPGKAGFRLHPVDRAILWWALVSVLAFTLLYLDFAALLNRLGLAYNTLGVYFLVRFLVRDSDDVDRVLKLFSIICAFVAVCMILEQLTGRNAFSVFGGVPAITAVRDGRIRSQGPFAHPIIAGTLGATFLPLFAGLWWAKRAKMYAIIGLFGGLAMTVTCASATPLMAIAAAIGAVFFWPFRRCMRVFRGAFVALLVGLHLVMKAPVWALIGRVSVIGGSSGDHRYELVNRTILHFSDWWLLGYGNTEQWGYLMHDTANAFVDAAITGGLLGLALFITILARCFRSIGLARKAASESRKLERRHWAWGAWLLANVVAFFGITYFDQSLVAWYSLLAMIPATASGSSGARAEVIVDTSEAESTHALSYSAS
jgi:hypothetical protein